jgi:hypothetical protein
MWPVIIHSHFHPYYYIEPGLIFFGLTSRNDTELSTFLTEGYQISKTLESKYLSIKNPHLRAFRQDSMLNGLMTDPNLSA